MHDYVIVPLPVWDRLVLGSSLCAYHVVFAKYSRASLESSMGDKLLYKCLLFSSREESISSELFAKNHIIYYYR